MTHVNLDSMIHKYKAIFFDFDGVIVDSVSVKTAAFSKLFEKYGETIVNQVISYHLANGGINRIDKFKYYYKELLQLQLDEKELSLLCKQFSEIVVDKIIHSKEIEGAEIFLKKNYLKINCFVVSATPVEELIEIIKGRNIRKYFKEIRGTPFSKTSHIKKLLLKYQLNSNTACFIGDAVEDYHAARECGLDFFGIISGTESTLFKLYPEIKWSSNFKTHPFIASLIS
jgi:HAD superfamily hydrolase (TIGR01549 family)